MLKTSNTAGAEYIWNENLQIKVSKNIFTVTIKTLNGDKQYAYEKYYGN